VKGHNSFFLLIYYESLAYAAPGIWGHTRQFAPHWSFIEPIGWSGRIRSAGTQARVIKTHRLDPLSGCPAIILINLRKVT
jgi:hypothetical protein